MLNIAIITSTIITNLSTWVRSVDPRVGVFGALEFPSATTNNAGTVVGAVNTPDRVLVRNSNVDDRVGKGGSSYLAVLVNQIGDCSGYSA
jgi:hypothetical protein